MRRQHRLRNAQIGKRFHLRQAFERTLAWDWTADCVAAERSQVARRKSRVIVRRPGIPSKSVSIVGIIADGQWAALPPRAAP